MKSRTSIILSLAVVGLISASFAQSRTIPRDRIQWRSDLHAAHQEAVKTGKPMLIVFSSTDCRHCIKFERTTLKNPGLVWSMNRSFVPLRLDAKKHLDIARKLEVQRIPATVALSPHADLLAGAIGYVNTDDYRNLLYRATQVNQKVMK